MNVDEFNRLLGDAIEQGYSDLHEIAQLASVADSSNRQARMTLGNLLVKARAQAATAERTFSWMNQERLNDQERIDTYGVELIAFARTAATWMGHDPLVDSAVRVIDENVNLPSAPGPRELGRLINDLAVMTPPSASNIRDDLHTFVSSMIAQAAGDPAAAKRPAFDATPYAVVLWDGREQSRHATWESASTVRAQFAGADMIHMPRETASVTDPLAHAPRTMRRQIAFNAIATAAQVPTPFTRTSPTPIEVAGTAVAAAAATGVHHVLTYQRDNDTAVVADGRNIYRLEIARASDDVYWGPEWVGIPPNLYMTRDVSSALIPGDPFHRERWSEPSTHEQVIDRVQVFLNAAAEPTANPNVTHLRWNAEPGPPTPTATPM